MYFYANLFDRFDFYGEIKYNASMKKIVVISDSHGNSKAIDRIFNEIKFDYLLYLGDGLSDLGIYVNDERVKLVRGNCDFFSREKIDNIVAIDNIIIFMTHGDKYGVKSTLRNLYNQVKDLRPNIVCYGHTHRFSNENLDGITFLNPGSLSSSRGSNSYAIINIEGEIFSIEKCSF